MEKLEICAVYDKKAKYFDTPFMVRSTADAVRGFQQAAKNDKSNIYNFPEDYYLAHIGTFNCETGKITQGKCAVLIEAKNIVAHNIKKAEK